METAQEELITLEEAASILKVHKRTVERMIIGGKVRAKDVSLGQKRKKWRVFKSDLLKSDNQ